MKPPLLIAASLALVVFALASFAVAQPPAQEPILRLDLGSGVGLDLVLVNAGTFRQGSPSAEALRGEDETEREVTISKPFYIGRQEVTVGQFRRFVEDTGYKTEAEKGTSGGFGWNGQALEQRAGFSWKAPGFPQTDEHPVTIVTFDDAVAFTRWLAGKTSRSVALPTEAQWEFAARAGSTSLYPTSAGKVDDPQSVGWSKANATGGTQPAGLKLPNRLGLVDMAGNVAEWCLDWYGPYEAGPVTDPVETRQNLSDKPRRVLRGGSWLREAKNGRCAARHRNAPGARNADNGFRVIAGLEAIVPAPLKAAPDAGSGNSAGDGTSQAKGAVGAVGRFFSSIFSFFFGMGIVTFATLTLVVIVFSSIASRLGLVKGPGGVRTVIGEDGFTLKAPKVPAGHRIHFTYVVDGVTRTGDALSSGDQAAGQVVYTGRKPASVRITAVTAPGEKVKSLTKNTTQSVATRRDQTMTRTDDDPGFRGYPSAY